MAQKLPDNSTHAINMPENKKDKKYLFEALKKIAYITETALR